MTLLTESQMRAIRILGERGMTTPVSIRRYLGIESAGGYEDPAPTYQTEEQATVVTGWLVSNMGRDFDEDGNRIVAVHDFTLRVPVGTVLDSRDLCTIGGAEYTVIETNVEDTWPEWTEVYLKKVQ
jgi:hypothetical protein